jgi:DNA-binding NtrC family response regulator
MNVINAHILVVDDDERYGLELKRNLVEIGSISIARSEKEFKTLFTPYKFDVILLDLRLRVGKEGLDLLDYIIDQDPLSAVIVISGYGDIATAVDALQRGAKTFLEKDKVSPQEIKVRVEQALKETAAERRIRHLEAFQEVDEIVGKDSKIQSIRDLIKLVAQDGETTVLIRGETGTGKELVARAIHRLGIRSKGPFVSVALTEKNSQTITSELFGHEKGSFTGAVSKHYGYFEQAHKGILFMDEIGDLPTDTQSRLLRVIDLKTFRRMGGDGDITVDVQVVAATNRNLEEMVKENSFREDLYYRLKVFEIHLPPIRERRSDIYLLAEYFLQQLRKKGRTPAKGFSDEVLEAMLRYNWPGNVRELKSFVERAALKCKLEGSKMASTKHIEPLLPTNSGTDEAADADVFRSLAVTELRMAEEALLRVGGKKTEAWKLLNYPNRFAMLRRIKRIFHDYPDLAETFPELSRRYS